MSPKGCLALRYDFRDAALSMPSEVNAVTGWDTSLLELMNAGERSVAMARVFNSREGFTIKDDKLPKRLFDPKPDGPDAGKQIFTEDQFNDAVRQYYEILGIDPVSGKPLRGKLLELGLEWTEAL